MTYHASNGLALSLVCTLWYYAYWLSQHTPAQAQPSKSVETQMSARTAPQTHSLQDTPPAHAADKRTRTDSELATPETDAASARARACFGVPLETVVAREGGTVPAFVQAAIEYLEAHGACARVCACCADRCVCV